MDQKSKSRSRKRNTKSSETDTKVFIDTNLQKLNKVVTRTRSANLKVDNTDPQVLIGNTKSKSKESEPRSRKINMKSAVVSDNKKDEDPGEQKSKTERKRQNKMSDTSTKTETITKNHNVRISKQNTRTIGLSETDEETCHTHSNKRKAIKASDEVVVVKEKKPGSRTNGNKETLQTLRTSSRRKVNITEVKESNQNFPDNNQKESNALPVRSTRKNSKALLSPIKEDLKDANDSVKRKRIEAESKQRSTQKRPRTTENSILDSSIQSESSPSRKSTRSVNCKVMFTAIGNDSLSKMVISLRGRVVDMHENCTVLVAPKIVRTVKFLCCLARGIPIVSKTWIEDSCKKKKLLDPWDYITEDKEGEKKFKFNLKNSLRYSLTRPLLRGYTVYGTTNIIPDLVDMKNIVQSCSGQFSQLSRIEHTRLDKSFIVSCEQDRHEWPKDNEHTIVKVEAILLGILQQKLNLKNHLLT